MQLEHGSFLSHLILSLSKGKEMKSDSEGQVLKNGARVRQDAPPTLRTTNLALAAFQLNLSGVAAFALLDAPPASFALVIVLDVGRHDVAGDLPRGRGRCQRGDG